MQDVLMEMCANSGSVRFFFKWGSTPRYKGCGVVVSTLHFVLHTCHRPTQGAYQGLKSIFPFLRP